MKLFLLGSFVLLSSICFAQGLFVNGTVTGYTNGETVTIDYADFLGESGSTTAVIDPAGNFSALLPIDTSYPGTVTACAALCASDVLCTYTDWASGDGYIEVMLWSCTAQTVVTYGTILDAPVQSIVHIRDIAMVGGNVSMFVQDDQTFSGSLWVSPIVAGSAELSWTDCNGDPQLDTLYWTSPDTVYNVALDGCPDAGNNTLVSISGHVFNVMTDLSLYYSGNGYTSQYLELDDNGNYSLQLYNMPEQGSEDICFTDCTGAQQCVTVSWDSENTNIIQDLDYCPDGNPASCTAEFEVLDYEVYNEPFTVYIIYPGSSAAGDYWWTFGDGGDSFDEFPTYIYSWEGTYEVCLSVICPDGNVSEFCATITLNSDGSVDGPGGALQPFTLHVISEFTGINELSDSMGELKVFPNPVSSEAAITWNSDKASAGTLGIYNALGQCVKQEKFISRTGANYLSVNTSQLESGYYVVRLLNDDGSAITTGMVK